MNYLYSLLYLRYNKMIVICYFTNVRIVIAGVIVLTSLVLVVMRYNVRVSLQLLIFFKTKNNFNDQDTGNECYLPLWN